MLPSNYVHALGFCSAFYRTYGIMEDMHRLYLAVTCPQVVDDIQLYDLLPLSLQCGKRQLLKTLSLNAALVVASCSAPKLHWLGYVFHLWCR